MALGLCLWIEHAHAAGIAAEIKRQAFGLLKGPEVDLSMDQRDALLLVGLIHQLYLVLISAEILKEYVAIGRLGVRVLCHMG